MAAIYGKYKEYRNLYGDIAITEEQNQSIRNNAAALQATYDYYQILLLELEKCIGSYHSIRNSLQAEIYSPAIKMNTINRNKK